MTLEERAEALANEYADEFLTGEAKEAILAALRAVVEACAEVEAAKEAVYSTLVDERKRLATLEAAVKEAGDAWQVQTNVREGITFRLKMKALLALRAGMR